MIQILSAVGSIAAEWFKSKRVETQAKHESKMKQIQSDAYWEIEQAKNANNSWKDEWFTIVLSIPMVGAFIPALVPYITQGFDVLSAMPEYYKGFLAAAIAASFGIKGLAQWKK